MKIRYNEFAPNPSLRNTIAHLPPHIAQNLIAQGVAIHVPYKNFVEYMSQFREGSDPNNSVVPPSTAVEWSCAPLATTQQPIIWRVSPSGERTRFEDEATAVQHGCPESVLKTFKALLAAHMGGVNAAEAARPDQVRREAEDKVGVWKTVFRRA